MRLTSVMWLGVFMRLETARNAYVTVLKKGAQQAGALFVVRIRSDQLLDLYGPAPQSFFDDEEPDRLFECLFEGISQAEADQYLEKQQKFDPDLWIIETEAGSGEISLEIRHSD
ncbi:MAG: DUF1491 family protein [Pseudomonadota bacterium]